MVSTLHREETRIVPDQGGVKRVGDSDRVPHPSAYTISRRIIGDEPTEIDTLGFEPYVNAVKDFLTANATKPPLTLSIEGEWGCGKSSFMRQLRNQLEGEDFQRTRKNKDLLNLTVEFNPWRHDKEDALWAAFALHFLNEISKKLSFTKRWCARFRLLRTRYDWKDGWLDCLKAFCFSVTVVYIVIAVPMLLIFKGASWWSWLVDLIPTINSRFDPIVEWGTGLGTTGALFGVLITVWGKLKEFLSNPLSFDLRKHMMSPDYTARIAFVENFHKDFKKIVDAYIGKKQAFVFIDDLDRCDVPKAADLMQSINLMISSDPRLFFIIGMDREKVAAGLAVKFEKAIPYLLEEASPDDPDEKVSKMGRGIEFGYTFIEKFIQIPFLVPQPKADKLETLLALESPQAIISIKSKSGDPGRQPKESMPGIRDADLTDEQRAIRQKYRFLLSETDSDALGKIVSWVTTFLNSNPRRIKQFINLFRLKVLIANETGLFDSYDTGKLLTMEQLAKFVVITLRWPLFLRDLEIDLGLFEKVDPFTEWKSSSSKERRAGRWRDRPALMDLLKYGCDRKADGENYDMKLVNVEKLLIASPHVRSTDVWKPDQKGLEVELKEDHSEAEIVESDEEASGKMRKPMREFNQDLDSLRVQEWAAQHKAQNPFDMGPRNFQRFLFDLELNGGVEHEIAFNDDGTLKYQ